MQTTRTSTPSTIRFHLLRLVVASVLPVWLVALVLVYHAYDAKRDQLNRTMLETAQTLTRVVDRELVSTQSALMALATSPSFAKGDMAAVRQQALQVLKAYPEADILVADREGRELMHTSRALGLSLPKRNNLDSVQRIFQTGRPQFSDLYQGALSKQPQISIDVPVFDNGRVVYDLALTIRSDPMTAILQQAGLPPDWNGMILDGAQILIATSPNSRRSVGSKMLSSVRSAAREGISEGTSLVGEPVLVSYSRSALSNWSVQIEVPKASVLPALYQWMGLAILGATIFSLVGIGLVIGYSRRIAQAIQSLVQPALSLGRAEMADASGSYAVKETGEVAAALVQAFQLLKARAAERDQAEAELLKTIDDLEKQTQERLHVLEKLSEKEELILDHSRQAAMGEMIGTITHQWRQPLHTLGLLIQQTPFLYERGEFNKKTLDDLVKKSLSLIHDMSTTIDEFKNFFMTDRNKQKFRVIVEVKRALQLVEGSFARHGIRVEVEENDEPFIFGYPNEFSQALLNILINAKEEFAKKVVENPLVRITMSGQNGRSMVTITDNAGGIPEHVIGKIFDPFFTTKESKSGAGVGLFMSKTLIEKNMGGALSVRNMQGGAQFHIEF